MKKTLVITAAWAASISLAYWMGSANTSPTAGQAPTAASIAGKDKPRATSPATATSTEAALDLTQGLIPKNLSSAQMAAALKGALAEDDPVLRSLKISQLLAGLNAENLPEALKAFESSRKGGPFDEEYRLFMNAWGKLDGQAAMTYATQQAKAGGNRRGMDFGPPSALSGWASNDPAAAKAWLDQQPNNFSKSFLQAGLVDGWAKNDLAGASAYAEALPQSVVRGFLVDMLADKYIAKSGPEAAMQWAQSIQAGEQNARYKESAIRTVADRIAQTNPQLAASFLAQNSEYAGSATQSVASTWARTDPTSALAWAGTLNGDASSQAVSSIVSTWAATNPAEAGNWLNSQADNANIDSLRRTYATTVAQSDPQGAIAWAKSISDANTQRSALIEVGREYMQNDPENAKAWLQQSGLDTQAQQSIERGGRGGRPGPGGGRSGRGGQGGGSGPALP